MLVVTALPKEAGEMNLDEYVDGLAKEALKPGAEREPEPLESVLKGQAVELYLRGDDRLFIVADEEDARRLGQPRGTVYTSAEVRRVIQIGDPATVAEVHAWKREFNAVITELPGSQSGCVITTRRLSKERRLWSR